MAASGRIKGITIELNGDSTKLVKALSSVDNSIRNTQNNLRDLDRALKLDPGNTELLKDRQQELAIQIDATKQKLETEKQALDQLRNSDGFDENSRQAQNLKTQIDLDTAALKDLESQAKQSASVLGTQMQAAGEKITAVGDKVQNIGNSMSALGQTLTTKVTMPIAGAFAASAKEAIDWETAFTGVMKTVDASEEEYNQLADAIKQMATETASSKEDIAGVMEAAGQLGVTGVDNLIAFTRTMVELGDTTNLSADEAATSLARFMNITGESYTDSDKLGSAIVDLGNNFATTESEILEMATRLASAGKIAGLSSTDILGLAASMSSVGINAEAGGTAMTQTLTAIDKAVNGLSDKLELMAQVAGMSADEFSDTWSTSPIEAIQAFITGLSSMDEESESTIKILDDLEMSGVRQSNMLKSLSLAADQLGGAISTSGEAYENNSALEEEATKRYETMAAKISQLKERFTNIAVEIGERLMPYIEQLMGWLEGLTAKWDALDDSEKNQILRLAAIVSAIGPVLLVGGKLVSGIGTVISLGGKLTGGIGTLITKVTALSGTGGLGGLSTLLGALTNPIGLVVAAIATLTGAFIYLYKTNDEFAADVNEKWDAIKQTLSDAWENSIKPALESMKAAFDSIMQDLEPVFEFLFDTIAAVVDGVVGAVGPITEAIASVVDWVANLIGFWSDLLHGDFTGALEHAKGMIDDFFKFFKNTWEAVGAFWEKFFGAFGLDINKIKTKLGNFANAVQTGWGHLKGAAASRWGSIKESIATNAKTAWSKATDWFGKMASNIESNSGSIGSAITDKIGAAIQWLMDLPGKAWNWGKDLIGNFVDGIKGALDTAGEAAGWVADKIGAFLHFSEPDEGALKNFHTFAPDMVKLFAHGIYQSLPILDRAAGQMASVIANDAMPTIQNGEQAASKTVNAPISITVNGAPGQDVNQLADIIQERMNRAVINQRAVFA